MHDITTKTENTMIKKEILNQGFFSSSIYKHYKIIIYLSMSQSPILKTIYNIIKFNTEIRTTSISLKLENQSISKVGTIRNFSLYNNEFQRLQSDLTNQGIYLQILQRLIRRMA